LDVECDLDISFNVDSSWTSWALDIEIVSLIGHHPLDVPFMLLIISMVPNNN
jgi:hypothetical protein